jgi:signal transduction histidine kinase
MQSKLVRLALFLFIAGMAYAVNFYYGYLYESKIQKAISVKSTLSDIATNSYLITESFDLVRETELSDKPELKENLLGRLNLLKLNLNLLRQQENLVNQTGENRLRATDTLNEYLQNLELAIEVLTPSAEKVSDPLSRKVALSSAVREVSRLTDLAYILEDEQNVKLNNYNKWLKFHSGLDAGIFISSLLIIIVLFTYPEIKMSLSFSGQINALKNLNEKAEKNAKSLKKEQLRLTGDLTETKKLLRIANYSLAKKNAAEYRAKQDFDHFVLLIGNRMVQPLQKLKETLNRLEEQLKSGKPEFARQSVESAYQKATAINRLLEAIQDMGKSLNSSTGWNPVYLGPLISEIIALHDNERNVPVQIQPNLPEVKAPKEPLMYILSELLNNAINHNSSTDPKISIDYELLSEMHSVTVSDNGEPLNEDSANDLFSTFSSGAESKRTIGNGVGLTISRYLAQRIGGNLIFQATKEGNKFTFEWPAKT